MYRTKTCGELRLSDAGQEVTLAGWVQRTRKMGGMTFADLRDRYGLTQLVFNGAVDKDLCDQANKLGREYCIQVTGTVSERESKNSKMPTGDIEIIVSKLNVLSPSLTPPFTIEDNTDGGDELRMKYRYLDLRRAAVRKNIELRHRMTILIRNFPDNQKIIEVETPILIGSTPEGARDFVVPSRMNPGQFYALPQSPQTLKQLLAAIVGTSRHANAADVLGLVEHAKLALALKGVFQFHKLHAEAQVGLVATKAAHGVVPGHLLERLGQLHTANLAEQGAAQLFEDIDDIVLIDKRHLAVDLRELGLTVGAQVLVAEALGT